MLGCTTLPGKSERPEGPRAMPLSGDGVNAVTLDRIYGTRFEKPSFNLPAHSSPGLSPAGHVRRRASFSLLRRTLPLRRDSGNTRPDEIWLLPMIRS